VAIVGSEIKGPAIDAETEPGIRSGASMIGGNRDAKRCVVVLFPPLDADEKTAARADEWKRAAGDSAWVAISTRFTRHPFTRKSPPNYAERSHMLLGRTVDQGRVRDVISMLDTYKQEFAKGTKVNQWSLAGQNQAAVIAAYAALLTPPVNEVILVDPPTSHLSGPHFPGILRVLDIPDALGLLAPRPLTILGDDPAFDRTAEIYRLAGAADKLKRVKK
jgi:hypothetical protein